MKCCTMSSAIFSNRSSRVINRYSWANSRSSLASCVSSNVGFVEHAFQIGVEVLVGELQFGDAILVVQRDGVVVRNRLAEVVDADVVAKDRAGLLFTRHERRAREGEEGSVGQRVAHVQRQRVVLAAVGFVGHDDDVGSIGELRIARRRSRVWNF